MADYHLHLFGIPELRTAAGERVYFRTRKHFGLLVYLALEGRDRGVPRDRLIELFWPDATYERPQHSLSQGLTAIRGILRPDALNTGDRHVQLTCDIESDLDRPGAVGDNAGIDSPTPPRSKSFESVPYRKGRSDALSGVRRRTATTSLRSLRVRRPQWTADGSAGLYRVDRLSDCTRSVVEEAGRFECLCR